MYCKIIENPGKPLLILLHGGGVAGWMWREQENRFASECELMIPDLPGHGQSAGETFVSIEACAEALFPVIDARAAGRPVFIAGLSLGAQITVELLSKKPVFFAGALINSALVIPMPLTLALMKPFMRSSLNLAKSEKFARVQAKQFFIGEELFADYYRDSLLMTPESFTAMSVSNLSYRLPEAFKNAKGRMIALYGEKEPAVMLKSLKKLKEVNPAVEALCMKGLGHGISLQKPEVFDEVLGALLRGGEVKV